MKRFIAAALMTGALATSALAAPMKFNIDPSHTAIGFAVNHFGFSDTRGRFEMFEGDLKLDMDKPENSSISMTIKTDSINTHWTKRDQHLRSPDFFNVKKFPTATFKSTKVEKTGENTLKVMGNMTILGNTKPVTFDVKVNRVAPHPFAKKQTVGMIATTTIKRSNFGMSTYLPNIGDEVPITIDMEAISEK